MPTIWGLFSRKIGLKAVWSTVLIGFVAAYIIKFGLSVSRDGFLTEVALLRPLVEWIAAHSRIVDLTAGLIFPFLILVFLELFEKHEHRGWQRVMETRKAFAELPPLESSTLPGKMVAICLAMLAIVMGVLAVINREEAGILIALAIVLSAIAGGMYIFLRRADAKAN